MEKEPDHGQKEQREYAVECGMDAGFGRGTKGTHVASFIVGKMMDGESGHAG